MSEPINKNLRIIFMGTPEFSAIILDKMISAGFTPMAVITTPDKPVGRKQILTPSPVKLLAEKNKIQVLQSENIRNCPLVSANARLSAADGQGSAQPKGHVVENLQPSLIVLAAFGQIIPKEILEIPKYGCLNIHPSLLPKYRGASPIQTAILNGDKETGVTIMLMDEKLDHGPIISNEKLKMKNEKLTYKELEKDLASLGAKLLIETLPKWISGEIKNKPQDESQATFTKIIKKEDGHINWQKSAEEIERMVRAYSEWPSAYAKLKIKNEKFKILKILKAEVLRIDHQKKPGEIFLAENDIRRSFLGKAKAEKELAVACQKDALILEEIQLEGKKIMSAQEFLNGHPEIINQILF